MSVPPDNASHIHTRICSLRTCALRHEQRALHAPVDAKFEFVRQRLDDGFNARVIQGDRLDNTPGVRTAYEDMPLNESANIITP